MNGKQHKIVGIGWGVAGAYLSIQSGGFLSGLLFLGSTIGCMIPDIDHDLTKIGRKRKAVIDKTSKILDVASKVIVGCSLALLCATMFGYEIPIDTRIVGLVGMVTLLSIILIPMITSSGIYKWSTAHRGIMHTLVPVIILYYTTMSINFSIIRYFLYGIQVGYVSHLFADMMTIKGNPILFPISKKYITFLKLKSNDERLNFIAKFIAVGSVVLVIMLREILCVI